jgi:hypothetical protein
MKDELMTSKEIIQKAGISRATLNNYIKYGILPKPLVRAPVERDEAAVKIGYFPSWALEKIRTVQAMKREGKAMDEIARIFSGATPEGPGGRAERDRSRVEPSSEMDAVPPGRMHQGGSFFSLGVVAVHFQDSWKIKRELPPVEYLALIDSLWRETGQIFDAYEGIRGRYPGDGLLYYFFRKPGVKYLENALKCSMEVVEKVRLMSKKWQSRKAWSNEIYMNAGIDEGLVFLGTIGMEPNSELVGVGDSITRAVYLSQRVRHGAVFATKGAVNRLDKEGTQSIVYGTRKEGPGGGDVFIERAFSPVFDLLDSNGENRDMSKDLGNFPVAQIASIR